MTNLNHRLHRRPRMPCSALVLTAVMAAVLGVAALAGCIQRRSPPPERQFVSPLPGKMKPVRFGKRIVLTILKPETYVLNSEMGETFEVHHIWRKKPTRLKNDANLGIFIGRFALPHCKGEKSSGKAVTPELAREAGLGWRSCPTSVAGLMARESFLPGNRNLVVHLFILGRNEAEMNALQRIARTLKLP